MRALLFAATTLRKPVAACGPSVVNNEDQLKAGFAEFQAPGERFGL